MNKDQRFKKEIDNARDKFGENNIKHGVEFFDSTFEGKEKIVFIENEIRSINVFDYIKERDHLKILGGGKKENSDITVAKVV